MATKQQEQRIFREAVQAALALDAFDLTLGYDDAFAIRFDDDEDPWYGVVHGTGGKNQGIVIARGPVGLRWIRDMADDVPDDDELDRFTERIWFSLVPREDVHPSRRGPLEVACVAIARDGLAPEFEAKERNKSAHGLRPREAKRITMATRALLEALDSADADAFGADHPPGVLPTLHLSGEWRAPDVAFELAEHVDDLERREAPFRRGSRALGWPVVEERWSVGSVEHAWVTESTPDEVDVAEPGPTPLLLVADAAAQDLVGYMPLLTGSPRRAARTFLRGRVVSAQGRMPRRFASHLTFTDAALRDAVAEALAAEGVECVLVDRDEAFERVHARLDDILREGAAAIARGEVVPDVPYDADEDWDEDGDDDDDGDGEGDHVHGPGCAHGHGVHDGGFHDGGGFDDPGPADEEPEEEPDVVGDILRDAGLTGGPGASPR